jgi:hypothetical protein
VTPPTVPADLAAAVADRYEVRRVLGRGGMATVYLAWDRKHQREVAIKVLRPDLAASIGSERFLKEIQIAARLTHPHILGLHDSGEAAAFLYYVMPYIEGGSLRQRLEGGPAARARGGTRDRDTGGRCPHVRPSHGDLPPRHQAREHPLLARAPGRG